MDGQISLDEYIGAKKKSLADKYPIPRLNHHIRNDEGWYDDWHYTQIEDPCEVDAYYAIKLLKDSYIYTYYYWANKWFEWNSSFEKWRVARDKPLAWVRIPREYRRRDPALKLKLDNAPIEWIGG